MWHLEIVEGDAAVLCIFGTGIKYWVVELGNFSLKNQNDAKEPSRKC